MTTLHLVWRVYPGNVGKSLTVTLGWTWLFCVTGEAADTLREILHEHAQAHGCGWDEQTIEMYQNFRAEG